VLYSNHFINLYKFKKDFSPGELKRVRNDMKRIFFKYFNYMKV